MRERVLITGARAPAALDIARSFAAAGFDVHMADCVTSHMARWSRGVSGVHRYPSPRRDTAGFRKTVLSLVERLAPRLVVPACEEVFHLAMMADAPKGLFAPGWPVLRHLHSKAMFAENCSALGLPVPETMALASQEDCAAFRKMAADYVFKREYSRFGTRTIVGPTPGELAIIAPSPAERWVAQRRVRGSEVSFYAVSAGSRLTAFAAYRSTWRFAGGAGYAFESLEAAMSDRLRVIAETLAERLIPKGQFACDVMIDREGAPWLLECNPRATSGAHFFGRSAELARAMLGEASAAGDALQRHVGPALWAYGLRDGKRREEWRQAWRAGKDVIGAEGDSAPVFGALLDTMAFGVKALASGKSLVEVTTADIEWNGEEL